LTLSSTLKRFVISKVTIEAGSEPALANEGGAGINR
jgi:hypothetical protein